MLIGLQFKRICMVVVFLVLYEASARAQDPKCDSVIECAVQMIEIVNEIKQNNTELLQEIAQLKAENENLEQKVSDNETSIGATNERISDLTVIYSCNFVGKSDGMSVNEGKNCTSGSAHHPVQGFTVTLVN